MAVKATHAVRRISWLSQRCESSARGAQRHGTRNYTRRETRDGRRSSIMHPPEPPDHVADTVSQTHPTYPTPQG
eukprot:606841-Prymnesium_polylepis.1